MSSKVGIFWQTDLPPKPELGILYGRHEQNSRYFSIDVFLLNEEQMTEDEELYKKFYDNPDVVSKVNTMNIEDIILWEEDLRKICLEAKATHARVSSGRKERVKKLSQEDRDRLITNPDGTEAINAVKVRKDRMSKADKLSELLQSMGLANASDLMKNIKTTETSQAIHNQAANSTDSASNNKFPARPVDDEPVSSVTPIKTVQTQEALLAEISTSLVNGLGNGRSADDLAKTATTAAHIARKLNPDLTKDKQVWTEANEKQAEARLNREEKKESKPLDLDNLFG